MAKKSKQSSTPDNITDDAIQQQQEDIFNKLPDALLLHILSLLPESDANRTRILSNRWKHLPALLPTLRFELSPLFQSVEECNKFHDFVDQTLALRAGIPIQRFFLSFPENCDYNRVYESLCTVVKCKVQQLELDFSADGNRVNFCWDLFKTCNTLAVLTLKGEFLLDLPEAHLFFPCLKKLNLLCVYYSRDESLLNLISGSPVLEELFVERQLCDVLLEFKVSSHSLKRLRILFMDEPMDGMYPSGSVIDTPNLEYLYIEDNVSPDYRFTEMPSLVEAYLHIYGTAAELFTCLSSAKTVTLTALTVDAVVARDVGMCRFPNLVKLVIDGAHWWRLLLLFYLDNMPNLEHITFLQGFVRPLYRADVNWNPPDEAPACLRSKMKEMIILNHSAVTQEELPFISYLLEHSSILETFTINAHAIDPERRHQILNFHRGSNLCRIEFF